MFEDEAMQHSFEAAVGNAIRQNQDRADGYRALFARWVEEKPILEAQKLVPRPKPEPPMAIVVVPETPFAFTTRISEFDKVCEPLAEPQPKPKPPAGTVEVGAPHWPGATIYQVGANDTMPSGSVVTKDGKRYVKHIVPNPMGWSQWYELVS